MSKFLKVALFAFVSVFYIGCGSGGGDNDNNDNTPISGGKISCVFAEYCFGYSFTSVLPKTVIFTLKKYPVLENDINRLTATLIGKAFTNKDGVLYYNNYQYNGNKIYKATSKSEKISDNKYILTMSLELRASFDFYESIFDNVFANINAPIVYASQEETYENCGFFTCSGYPNELKTYADALKYYDGFDYEGDRLLAKYIDDITYSFSYLSNGKSAVWTIQKPIYK
jgi:hypothetical protein